MLAAALKVVLKVILKVVLVVVLLEDSSVRSSCQSCIKYSFCRSWLGCQFPVGLNDPSLTLCAFLTCVDENSKTGEQKSRSKGVAIEEYIEGIRLFAVEIVAKNQTEKREKE